MKGRAIDGRNIYFLFSYFFSKHEGHLCLKLYGWKLAGHVTRPDYQQDMSQDLIIISRMSQDLSQDLIISRTCHKT